MTSADYNRDQRVIELRLEQLEAGNREILRELQLLREESIRRRAYWKVVAAISAAIGAVVGPLAAMALSSWF